MIKTLFLFLLFISCKGLETKSKITPLFEPKTLKESLSSSGNNFLASDDKYVKFRFKIPLGQDMIGHYDYAAIMSEKNDDKNLSVFKKFLRKIKHAVYNMGIGIGVMNKVKISTDYEFPDLDSEFIKSVKINRIFVSLDQCSPQDFDCIDRYKKDKLSIQLLKSFFVNLSVATIEDRTKLETDFVEFLSASDFKKYEKMASNENALILNEHYRKENPQDQSMYYDITVAKLFKEDIDARIKNKIEPPSNKVFKFKTATNHVEVKRFFEKEEFKNIVKEVSLVGQTVYVELVDLKVQDRFFSTLNASGVDIVKLGVDVFERCTVDKCVDLSVNSMDLMAFLRKSPHIKFDTFLSLRKLKFGDFKYTGYVELEVALDLPM